MKPFEDHKRAIKHKRWSHSEEFPFFYDADVSSHLQWQQNAAQRLNANSNIRI